MNNVVGEKKKKTKMERINRGQTLKDHKQRNFFKFYNDESIKYQNVHMI